MARASPKAKRIYEAGLVAYKGDCPASADKMLRAIAMMLTEATKPASKVKKKAAPTLPFGPGELYDTCLARVSHIMACEPYNKLWFSRLGKKMQDTSGLEASDLETLVSWIEGGGLDFGDSWSFSHLIKHFDTWITKARAAGPQQASGIGVSEYME